MSPGGCPGGHQGSDLGVTPNEVFIEETMKGGSSNPVSAGESGFDFEGAFQQILELLGGEQDLSEIDPSDLKAIWIDYQREATHPSVSRGYVFMKNGLVSLLGSQMRSIRLSQARDEKARAVEKNLKAQAAVIDQDTSRINGCRHKTTLEKLTDRSWAEDANVVDINHFMDD